MQTAHGMTVFVTGATGVIGLRTVGRLVAAGHTVTGVSRSPEKDALLGALGLTSNYSNSFADKLRAVASIADRVRHDQINTF